jgi:hypothetical protein
MQTESFHSPRSEIISSTEFKIFLSGMARVHFPVSQSPQMTFVGQVFTLAVVVVAPLQPAVDPKYFATGGALDLPLWEKINDTLGLTNVEDQNMH